MFGVRFRLFATFDRIGAENILIPAAGIGWAGRAGQGRIVQLSSMVRAYPDRVHVPAVPDLSLNVDLSG